MCSLAVQLRQFEAGDERSRDQARLPTRAVNAGRNGLVDARPTATLHRLMPARELVVIRQPPPPTYRDAVCDLCEKTVSLALDLPLAALQAKTRQSRDIAQGRQIAMYLANTMFEIAFSEIGLHFKRDRTTVSHACAVVEDKRDDLSFDVMLCQLEALLIDAKDAVLSIERPSREEG